MFRGQKVYALIPARGGSKGVLRKNLATLAGNPLISYSIEAALVADDIDEVYVSSEDEEILGVARALGAKIISRPRNLAQDDTPTAPVIAHAIEHWDRSCSLPGFIVLLQPTSPQRTGKDIDEAFALLDKMGGNNLISVYEPPHHPLKAFLVNEEGYLKGLLSERESFTRRQDLPPAYMPNGAIYIFTVTEFLAEQKIPMERVFPFVMPIERSVDIDTIADLQLVSEGFRDDTSHI